MKAQIVQMDWVLLPLWVQAAVRAWTRAEIPGIKDFAYFWNRHLTEEGKFSILRKAGID